MTNFLNINGLRIPVKSCELQPMEIGTRERSVDGSMIMQRRHVKRRWKVDTALLSWADANSIWQMVQGRGHHWQFNGAISPQDNTTTYYPSAGGLNFTNSPGGILEMTTASDGATVQHAISTTAAGPVSAYGVSAYYGAAGTTNRLSADTSNAENASTGYVAANATLSADTTHKWQGTKSLKIVTNNAGAFEGALTDNFTTVATTTYTASVYVKSTTGGEQLLLEANTSAGAVLNNTTFTIPAANIWYRISWQFTATTTSSQLRVLSNIQAAYTIYCDGFMATDVTGIAWASPSWVVGGSSRAAAQGPRFTPTIIQNLSSFTVSAWIRSYIHTTDVIWEWGTSLGISVAKLLLDSGVPHASILTSAGATAVDATIAGALTPASTWYHLCFVVDTVNQNCYLYKNGTLGHTVAYATPVSFSGATVFSIGGSAFATTNQFSGGLDEVILLPYAVSSSGVTALYSGVSTSWPVAPKVVVTGDAIDGSATCIGNTSTGTFSRVFRSSGDTKNNIVLSFDLEEV